MTALDARGPRPEAAPGASAPRAPTPRAGVRTETVVVIGAGAAGLAAALSLAAADLPVILLDKADETGGKIRALPAAANATATGVDAGPTVFTMRWVFDALFEAAGARLSDHLTLRPLEVLARHRWDGEAGVFDLPADREQAVQAIGAFAGAADARGYEALCRRAGRIYEILAPRMLAAQKPSELALTWRLGPAKLLEMLALSPPVSLWRALGAHLRDPRLRQLFARYATYCGSSPFAAPATLMLVAHVERCGVWTLDGGMTALPRAMTALARAKGVQIRCGAAAAEIETTAGRVSGVRLQDGARLAAGAVIFAGDPAALADGLLGDAVQPFVKPRAPQERSLSALVWTGAARAEGAALSHHNLFFSNPRADGGGYRAEFDSVFTGRQAPTDPTTYVCAQDRGAAAGAESDRPPAPERLQILINAPANGDDPHRWSEEEINACQTRTFALLRRQGLQIDPAPLTCTSPSDFHHLFPATGGALYGAANHALLATFRRPGARTVLPGLYLASGAAHPGPGVPMATLSGRLAAEALTADLALSARRRRAGMSGGMSTD